MALAFDPNRTTHKVKLLTLFVSAERQEEKLKNDSRDLSMVKMKSMVVIAFTFTSLMGMFNSM